MDTIRIKEMNGHYACGGYFYADGKKLKPGETVEVEDAEPHLDSGFIELVTPKRRKKEPANEVSKDQI